MMMNRVSDDKRESACMHQQFNAMHSGGSEMVGAPVALSGSGERMLGFKARWLSVSGERFRRFGGVRRLPR